MLCLLPPVTAVAGEGGEGQRALPDYRAEVEALVDVPGASGSVAAGTINPAAWVIQPAGGLYCGFTVADSGRDKGELENLQAILSFRKLAFAYRRHYLWDGAQRDAHLDEYTLGIGGGNRGHAFGLSYSWSRGRGDLMPRHERLAVGDIFRLRQFSLGMSATWDLEEKDNFWQVDVGVRPFGPRLTLFADAVQSYGERFKDITVGYGLAATPIPGLTLAAKANDFGDFTNYSVRAGICIGRGSLRPEARMRLNEDGDHVASTYVLETGPYQPPLGRGLLRKGRRFPELDLRGPMTYRRYRWFDERRSLLGTLRQINRCAEDPRIGGVVLNLSGMRIGPEKVWELREQLAGLRAQGKKVIVYFDRVGMVGYMLASVADQIWMDPQGMLSIPGLCFGKTYVHNALEKLGIEIQELRFFTHKSAMESFTRTSMSEADREQITDLLDDIYQLLSGTVTSARGITPQEWDRLVDEKAMLLPQEALEAGLVDSIGTLKDAKDVARKAERRPMGGEPGPSLAGVMGDPVWGPLQWGEPDRIAILYAIGPCQMDAGINGRVLSKKIKTAREDKRVKAIVLRADSPGGDPLPSDLVARELLETSKVKPVIVSQGMVAASGGYWISMYGDSIVAAPLTITGSIGVIGGYAWDNGLGDKIGFTYDFVKRGEHADRESGIRLPFINQVLPNRPYTDKECRRAEKIIRDLYDNFVGQVAKGRGMTKQEVDQIGQGRIWSGIRAKRNGLIDEIGGLWESLRIAKEAAGLPTSRRIQLTEGPQLGAFNLGALFRRSRVSALWESPQQADAPTPSSGRTFADDLSRAASEEGPWSLGREDSWIRALLGDVDFSMLTQAQKVYLEYMLRSQGRPILLMKPIEMGPDLELR